MGLNVPTGPWGRRGAHWSSALWDFGWSSAGKGELICQHQRGRTAVQRNRKQGGQGRDNGPEGLWVSYAGGHGKEGETYPAHDWMGWLSSSRWAGLSLAPECTFGDCCLNLWSVFHWKPNLPIKSHLLHKILWTVPSGWSLPPTSRIHSASMNTTCSE